jgi:hypothetical protein
MPRKRKENPPEYAVFDEAAACIADALMNLALQFEANHYAEIRRHYDPWQLDLFRKHPPF